MTDDKRELENTEDHGAGAFGSARGEGSGAHSDAFGGFGSSRSETVYGEEIVPEHLDELPDIENVEDYVGEGHVYDEETAGALVALMFAKTHQTEDDQPPVASYEEPAETSARDFVAHPEESLGSSWGTATRTAEPKKKSKLGVIVTVLIVAVALAIAVVSTMMGTGVEAPMDYEFVYSNNYDGTITLYEYNGPGGIVYIPDSANGMPVTSIAASAFSGNRSITDIYIPSSVTAIEDYAFRDCTSLTHVELSTGVARIGRSAFAGCTSLNSIFIPSTVEHIGEYAFAGCDNLNYVYASSLESWLGINFYSWESNPLYAGLYFYVDGVYTDNIVIPESIGAIKDYAFAGYSMLKSVEIHDGVTSIGRCSFYECEALEAVFIPSSVGYIADGAFSANDFLTVYTSMTFQPAGWQVNWHGDAPVIWGAESINCVGGFRFTDEYGEIRIDSYVGTDSEVVIPTSILGRPVVVIGEAAFRDNNDITSVTIADTVKMIEDYAFYGCSSLTSIYLPDSVDYVGEHAFDSIYGLTISTPYGAGETPAGWPASWCGSATVMWESYDTRVDPIADFGYVNMGGYIRINSYYGADASVVIPSYISNLPVTNIGEYAFAYNTTVKHIVLPDSVTRIENYAFSGCVSLKSIKIPEGLEYFASYAFHDCSSLREIDIPDTVTEIGGHAFSGCTSLTEVFIPASVEVMGGYVFENCDLTINCEAESRPEGWSNDWSLWNSSVVWDYYPASPISDFTYELSPEGAVITGYIGSATKVCIPAEIEGFAVRYIKGGAFAHQSSILKVIIPDSVVEIGDSAFVSCYRMTEVVIPEGVETIKYWAFSHCTSLRSVVIPASVTKIEEDIFYGNNYVDVYCVAERFPDGWHSDWDYSVNSVTWGYIAPAPASEFEYTVSNGEVTIDKYFGDRTKVRIPERIAGNPVTAIGLSAFANNYTVTSVIIPEGVVSIGGTAFYGCESLQSITIPSSIDYISDTAFESATALEGTEYENAIYLGNENNPYLVLLKAKSQSISYCMVRYGAEFIYANAFRECDNLGSIEIPYTVRGIGSYAFNDCDSLTNVSIGNGLEQIGAYVFTNSPVAYNSYGNALYLGNSSNPYLVFIGPSVDASTLTECVIHDDARIIAPYAFDRCSSLQSVTIPYGVTFIGEWAFSYCDSLSAILIPASVEKIRNNAFYGSSDLEIYCESETRPSGWDYGWNTKDNSWDHNVVWDYNPDAFESLFDYSESDDGITITRYKGISKYVEIPEYYNGKRITAIDARAFYENSAVMSVVIPESVTSIGAEAFYGCAGLASIVIPDSVVTIGSYAFGACGSLVSVTIGSGVRFIGYSAFLSSTNIKDVYIKDIGAWCMIDFEIYSSTPLYYADNLRFVGNGEGDDLITEIVIPNGVSVIEDYAFYGLDNLTYISIPDGVERIGDYAFYGCLGLTSLVIPDGAKSIGTYAFAACQNLVSISVPDSLYYVGSSAFSDCRSLVPYEGENAEYFGNANNPFVILLNVNGEVASFEIPSGTRVIYDYAFSECNLISHLVIPDGVGTIGTSAFSSCTSLLSINIPESVRYIGLFAFSGCRNLTSLVIPRAVYEIGYDAFYGCTNLTLYCEVGEMPEGWNANWNDAGRPVVWNCNSESAVSDFEHFESNGGIVIYKYLGNNTNVVIPKYINNLPVTAIYNEAFWQCTEMKRVVIPDTVASIGDSAFAYCSSLIEIEMPSSLVSIGDRAFAYSPIRNIVFPESMQSIGDQAFLYCSSLSRVVIPEGVTLVGYRAFTSCGYVVIYCGSESQPSGWDDEWNYDGYDVVWGYSAV